MSNTPAPNPNVPQSAPPLATLEGLTYTVRGLKQAVDSLAGFLGAPTNRAVTFNDLIHYGLLDQANVVSQTGTTTLGKGSVTLVDTSGDGIHGGPITHAGTLSVDWNGGEVVHLGSHLSLSGGTLDATGFITQAVTTVVTGAGLSGGPITSSGTITANWQADIVTELTGMQLNDGTLQTNWRLPVITALGDGLVRHGTTLDASAAVKNIWAPVVTGETPGPVLAATPDGQCVMVPIS